MTYLTQFLILWTRTPSDYDTLVARSMTYRWASAHLPVLSQKGEHTLYTGYHITQPRGELVVCPGCEGVENRRWEIRKREVTIRCKRCRSECVVDKVSQNRHTGNVLDHEMLVKVSFPQPRMKTTWTFRGGKIPDPKPVVATAPSRPLLAPSASAHIIPPPPSEEVSLPPPELVDDSAGRFEAMEVDPAPSTIATLPLSLAPSPSPSPAPANLRLTITVPPRAALNVSQPSSSSSTTRSTRRSRRILGQAPAAPSPIERSHLAPEAGASTELKSPADFRPFYESFLPNKRRKRS